MPKCLLSGEEIGQGEAVIEPTKHLLPGEAGLIKVSSLRRAFNNTTVVEELRKDLRSLQRKLGEE